MQWMFFLLLVPSFLFPLAPPSNVGAYVILDARTGRVLDEKAKDDVLYPASCTKIATLLYILAKSQDLPLEQKLVVPREAVVAVSAREKEKKGWSAHPSYVLEHGMAAAGLLPGEIVTLKDLLYGMMLPSGNDAANALAYYWGGRSVESFMTHLNDYVKSLGLQHTHFCNPHGLPHPDHVSSAYDLALLAKVGLENSLFREIVRTPSYTKAKTNKRKESVVWENSNKLLRKGPFYLEEAIGIKTGYHQRAQHCLVAAAENRYRSIILVFLKHPERALMFRQAKALLNGYMREKFVEKELVSAGDLKLTLEIPGCSKAIPVQAQKAPFTIQYFPSEKPEFEAKVHWHTKFPPLSEQDEVGLLEIYRDKKLIATLPLVPSRSVSPTLATRYHQAQAFLSHHKGLTLFLVILGVGVIGGLFWTLRRFKSRR